MYKGPIEIYRSALEGSIFLLFFLSSPSSTSSSSACRVTSSTQFINAHFKNMTIFNHMNSFHSFDSVESSKIKKKRVVASKLVAGSVDPGCETHTHTKV